MIRAIRRELTLRLEIRMLTRRPEYLAYTVGDEDFVVWWTGR